MQSLAVKYRPQTFEECLSQRSVITILKNQLAKEQYTNCYGFCGPSGCGKTTIARIFGRMINKGKGEIFEVDGASNNGVENIRKIIDEANSRAIDGSEYKIFIIDECHMITTAGWNAFLKTIEEPPKYSIFMFCTTNPEKMPATITNRIMKFNLTKIETSLIKSRLEYICQQEGFTNYEAACDYISKLSQGGVRDAISLLDKVANYNIDLSIENVLECLGDFSYDSFFNLTLNLLNQDEGSVLSAINDYYNQGKDLKLFVDQYLDFALDLAKYCLYNDIRYVKIPSNLDARCKGYASIPNILDWTNNLIGKVLDIKNLIKYDVNAKTTIEASFIALSRGI